MKRSTAALLKTPRTAAVGVACLALAAPAVLASGIGTSNTTPAAAHGNPAAQHAAHARQARPVIDTGYLYDRLYTMASNDIYRVSGQDGPPQDPSSPANLPPTINGWQEFYAQWKHQMTSPSAMGPMARYVRVSDHYFRVQGMPYDSDVAEVTIPGSTCPGQRILIAGHPDSTPVRGDTVNQLINQGKFTEAMDVLYRSNLGNGSPYDDTSGVTMGMAEFQALLRWWQANGTWPTRTLKVGLFDAEETGLNGSFYYARNLIPQGPQGQYALVANMDQNGMEYPAYHWGTDHYLNNLTGGGVGPWYTNINASPLSPNDIYNGQAWQNIEANMPAIQHFRTALQAEVSRAFQVLGAKYHYRVPLENPLLITDPTKQNPVKSEPAYTPSQQQQYSPVQDDTLGRTDQVPFVAQGIPGYGVLGAYDTNSKENPYPTSYTNKPEIFQYAGYDTMVDTIEHLNLFTSGMPHGKSGPASPSEELRRALELPATWTSYLVARGEYAGASPRPSGPVAYFETDPVHPSNTTTVRFDGRFAADAGNTGHLTYVWDFGDGSYGVGPTVSHTYSGPQWADVKLVVIDGHGHVDAYRQAVNVDGATSAAPATDACGNVSVSTARQLAAHAHSAAGAQPAQWTPSPANFTDHHAVTPAIDPKKVVR